MMDKHEQALAFLDFEEEFNALEGDENVRKQIALFEEQHRDPDLWKNTYNSLTLEQVCDTMKAGMVIRPDGVYNDEVIQEVRLFFWQRENRQEVLSHIDRERLH